MRTKKTDEQKALELRKQRIKQVGIALALVSIFLSGILAVNAYSGVIHHIEQNGVNKYKQTHGIK